MGIEGGTYKADLLRIFIKESRLCFLTTLDRLQIMWTLEMEPVPGSRSPGVTSCRLDCFSDLWK